MNETTCKRCGAVMGPNRVVRVIAGEHYCVDCTRDAATGGGSVGERLAALERENEELKRLLAEAHQREHALRATLEGGARP